MNKALEELTAEWVARRTSVQCDVVDDAPPPPPPPPPGRASFAVEPEICRRPRCRIEVTKGMYENRSMGLRMPMLSAFEVGPVFSILYEEVVIRNLFRFLWALLCDGSIGVRKTPRFWASGEYGRTGNDLRASSKSERFARSRGYYSFLMSAQYPANIISSPRSA